MLALGDTKVGATLMKSLIIKGLLEKDHNLMYKNTESNKRSDIIQMIIY